MNLLLLLCSAMSAYAGTPEDEARARELFDNGATLYEEGNYEASIVAFREAYRLFPAPEMHYNMANCLERLGDLKGAYDELNLYRAVAPADERETLERRVRALENRLSEAEAEPTPAPAPAPAPAPVEPEPAVATAVKHQPRWWMVGLGAGLAAGGGVGAGLTYSASRDHLAAADESAYGTDRTLNGVSFGVVGLGVVVGALGFVLPVEKEVVVAVAPHANGGGLLVGASF